MREKIQIDPFQLYGAISTFMSRLYDDTHEQERTVISQFIIETAAKDCVSHIKEISIESQQLGINSHSTKEMEK